MITNTYSLLFEPLTNNIKMETVHQYYLPLILNIKQW